MLEQNPSSFFYTTKAPQTVSGTTQASGAISVSLNTLRGSCGKEFKKYDMQGAQSATTTVKLQNGETKKFRTTDQMHSEMKAIEYMLEHGEWALSLGVVVWAHDNSPVTLDQFRTTEPHCGFCTLFLLAAHLPVGTPTCGNYQLASRLAYQLPVDLETSPYFIARVLDKGCYCGFPALKRLLNAFMKVPADQWVLSIYGLAFVDEHTYVQPAANVLVVDWSQLVEMHKREVIYLAWKVIYEQLLLTNKQNQ